MIYKAKDITEIEAPAIIAHGVNCSDAMGSGVARALYMKWPMVKGEFHKKVSPELGDTQFIEVEEDLIVVNCFTQRKYGRDGERYASPAAIGRTLTVAAAYAIDREGLSEVHIPKIGCGLGGLDWEEEVVPVLEAIEETFPITFVVHQI